MHTEPIIKLLGIKDTHVDGWDSGENEAGLWFERRTAVRKQKCPKCR
ncbi:ISL3 family transposase, partial [Salibacterium salarium]